MPSVFQPGVFQPRVFQGAAGSGTLALTAVFEDLLRSDADNTVLLSDADGLTSLYADGADLQGIKNGFGTGTDALVASFAATGTKKLGATGSLAASAAFAQTGIKKASGAGTLALVPAFAYSAAHSDAGAASFTLTPAFSATGRKAASATGSIALSLATTAGGTKRAAGSGALSTDAVLAATGTGSGSAVVTPAFSGGNRRLRQSLTTTTHTPDLAAFRTAAQRAFDAMAEAAAIRQLEDDETLILLEAA